VFSHYRLNVEPLLFDRAAARQEVADDAQRRWCSTSDLDTLGLPAPVRKLLLQLTTDQPPPLP
jgi:A/G-specific adenine glycosylase